MKDREPNTLNLGQPKTTAAEFHKYMQTKRLTPKLHIENKLRQAAQITLSEKCSLAQGQNLMQKDVKCIIRNIGAINNWVPGSIGQDRMVKNSWINQ